MTYLLYDIAIGAILLLFFLLGRKKGLVLTLCGLAAIFVAFFGARFAAQTFTPQVSQAIQPHILETIQVEGQEDISLEEILSDESSVLVSALNTLGLQDELAETVKSILAQDADDPSVGVAQAISSAIARVVASVLVFVVAFLLLLVVWSLISKLLDLAARLPVINFLNRTLGGLAGLVKGCILLFLAAWVLRMTDGLIPTQAIEQTVLLRFFCTTSPLALISGI